MINFPKRLDNNFSSYNFLSNVQNQIIDSPEEELLLDLRNCESLHPIFTSYLGALGYVGNYFQKKIQYITIKGSQLNNYLKASGLYGHFVKEESEAVNSDAIPFSIITMDEDFIIRYIDNILDLAPITLTEQAREVLFKNIYEIFINSVDHSRAQLGVFACGYWMSKEKYLAFSVYDTGIGIPALVKEKVDSIGSSQNALQWALTRGNSTKQMIRGIPRGLGLADLNSFIKLNAGELNIFTNDVYYMHHGEQKFQTVAQPTIGTFIGITIVADYDHIYTVKQ